MLLFPLLLASLAAITPDPENTNLLGIPPEYQHETVVVLHTVDTQGEINFICGKAPKGYKTLACNQDGTKLIYIPNPCLVPEASNYDSYAHLLCHEIGHTEGWHHVNE